MLLAGEEAPVGVALQVEVWDPGRAQDVVEVPHDKRVARVLLLVG